LLGIGDGTRHRIPLVKIMADQRRRSRGPWPGACASRWAGAERTGGLDPCGRGGSCVEAAPPPGAEVRAGFGFDVPVRFAEGPADDQPRNLRSRRGGERAADRDPGGAGVSIVDPELMTIAICWRLERRDGICLGVTTHDRDLAIGGLRYRSARGMLPSAISLSDGFDARRWRCRAH
jgi:hypothetical protein